jgi:uncharacterized protein (DUF305 family)
MKRNNIIILIVGIIAITTTFVYAINNDSILRTSTSTKQDVGMVDKNSSDYKMYSELKGEDYDRIFIANMIAHHQGAVDMANLALKNAKHQEIKDMANAIITAQTKEISSMGNWQKEWNYPSSSGPMMEDHSSMGMMSYMTAMNDSIKDLSNNEFDKAFLSSMIEHHQSAINMAYPGQNNASHNEVRVLTKAIVEAQSKEITQMKQWQKEWNY